MDEAQFREAIREALGTLGPAVESALRRELARTIDLGHSGRLQFEACPFSQGITLTKTEETILPGDLVWQGIPEDVQSLADAEDFDLPTAVNEELLPWFADRWQAVGGPRLFSPAYAFFHGGLHEPRYDLERRRWLSVDEAFGE